MKNNFRLSFIAMFAMLAFALGVAAQAPDAAANITAQKEAMKPFAVNHGIWRGLAATTLPDGRKLEITQTERVGPFLDGSVMVLEGRGYDPKTGSVLFNAFGTISYDPTAKTYTLHSYAQGRAGDFPVTATPDGYIWQIAAGPATIRYTISIKDGVWHEVGDRIMPGKDPARFFEMTLKRISSTDWPSAGAVPMK